MEITQQQGLQKDCRFNLFISSSSDIDSADWRPEQSIVWLTLSITGHAQLLRGLPWLPLVMSSCCMAYPGYHWSCPAAA